MKNRRSGASAAIALLLLLAVLSFVLAGCGAPKDKNTSADYTVGVKTQGGMPLSDITVSVYADSTKSDLVWKAQTDGEGMTSFRAPSAEGCVAVLSDLPAGYIAEEQTELSAGHNGITVETVILEDANLGSITYELGSVVHDFTVTASDGTEYRISELLEEKKAVVLNFWYLNCAPCRMEFPYLQQAYAEYSDKLEVLALNPLDGTDENITAFANELKLTFPMSACAPEWEECMQLTAYPTTVVIDRYGTIAMIHKGYITQKEVFCNIFEYFTSDGYTQTAVKDLSEIEKN